MRHPRAFLVFFGLALLLAMALPYALPARADNSADGPLKVKAIEAERLTVRTPGSKSSVSIIAGKSATGIFVSSGKGGECIALVCQPGQDPYLIIHNQDGSSPAPVAITADHLQLPKMPGKCEDVAVLSYQDLLRIAGK